MKKIFAVLALAALSGAAAAQDYPATSSRASWRRT
jgi:hypothetical protein